MFCALTNTEKENEKSKINNDLMLQVLK